MNGNEQTIPARATRIEQSIDREITRDMKMSMGMGGLIFGNVEELLNFAKLMAISSVAIPKHLRDNPGACMAVVLQAVEWKMSPFAVANKTYVVNDRIAFESQLIHAVVEQRAPLVGRLRHRFTGEGGQRHCIVSGLLKGEKEPLEFQSATFDQIQPKNSPLWKTKPDLQLYYNASRDWARMYVPDVILGIYAEDEIEQKTPEPPIVGTMSRTQAVAEVLKKGQQKNLVCDQYPATQTEPVEVVKKPRGRPRKTEMPSNEEVAESTPPEPVELTVEDESQEPAADKATQEAPAEESQEQYFCANRAEFEESAQRIGRQRGLLPEQVNGLIKRWLLLAGGLGAEFKKLASVEKQRWLTALAAGKVTLDNISGR